MNVLYKWHDGLLELLGQSSVLAYLKQLAAGRPIHLVSFKKADGWPNVTEHKRLARYISASGVWHRGAAAAPPKSNHCHYDDVGSRE